MGGGQAEPRQAWSDLDDLMMKVCMELYEHPLKPPLTFRISNAAGQAVSVSSLDISPDGLLPHWWEGWSCLFPITIFVTDPDGKGFSLQLPAPSATA